MDVIVQLKNFSYYHQKSVIYCNGLVLESRITSADHSKKNYFSTVIKGTSISCKHTEKLNIAEKLSALENIIVKLRIDGVEVPSAESKDQSVKFLFTQAEECVILAEA